MADEFDRLTLLHSLDVTDPGDPSTWAIGGRPLRAEELEVVRSATAEDWKDAATMDQARAAYHADVARGPKEVPELLGPYWYGDATTPEALERAPSEVQYRAFRIVHVTMGSDKAENLFREVLARAIVRSVVERAASKPGPLTGALEAQLGELVRANELSQEEVDALRADIQADPQAFRERLVEFQVERLAPDMPIPDWFRRMMRESGEG